MKDAVVRVQGLGKQYRIGLRRHANRTFGEMLVEGLAAPFRRKRSTGAGADCDDGLIWALQDVSFDVARGEVVGIIGANGAGKSTLLKILSRITEPTTGRALLRGRVASLLEVGTGFHPELTGRENIYLNGAMLGMKRAEIARKFDEIVAFAEIEKFLDTPVKRYSSGMYVRLAFAVAAHLEPEILVVDEVLAVGDADFQKKCLGQMQGVSRCEGRTVLFVSHNMVALRNLCMRALWLDRGRIRAEGEAAAVVHEYLSSQGATASAPDIDLTRWANRRGSGNVRFTRARLLRDGRPCGRFERLGPMTLEFTFEAKAPTRVNLSAICATNGEIIKVLQLAHQDSPGFDPEVTAGQHTVRVEIDRLPLQCGEYHWMLGLHTEALVAEDVVFDILHFVVEDELRTSPRPYRSINAHGLCTLLADWRYVEEGCHAVQPV